MKLAAVVVAAGQGLRAGGEKPKQYSALGSTPVLAKSIAALHAAGAAPIVVVIDSSHQGFFDALGPLGAQSVLGGATRTASVRAGLEAIAAAAPDYVLIHDAARPGVTPEIVRRLIVALEAGSAGAAPAIPSADALKRIDQQGNISEEVDRQGLMRVQTPQAFQFIALRDAYAKLPKDAALDDDLSVVRAAGYAITTVPGDPRLMKLTYPEDWTVLEALLAPAPRGVSISATGFDAHRFGPGDHVTLCGVRIAHTNGLIGHSDADAGWHALTDAILGAAALGDIGDHFPPSDPEWRGADSELFLRHAAQLARSAGARILHADITLIGERPKIAPHREAMRARTAEALELPLSSVSVKATTTERMGFLGREEGLAALATATLLRE